MGEWLKPAVLKTVSGVTRSGVRIPLPPPLLFFLESGISIDVVLHHRQIASESWSSVASDVELFTRA
jgi:hypothetical protein